MTKDIENLKRFSNLKEASTEYAKIVHPTPQMVTFREYTASDFEAGAKWMQQQQEIKNKTITSALQKWVDFTDNHIRRPAKDPIGDMNDVGDWVDAYNESVKILKP